MCRFTSRSSSGRRQSDTTANKTTVTICSRAIEACVAGGSAFHAWRAGTDHSHLPRSAFKELSSSDFVVVFLIWTLGGHCGEVRRGGAGPAGMSAAMVLASKNELTSNLKLPLFTVPSHHRHNDLHFIIYSSFKSTPLSFSISSNTLVYCRESILE